MSLFEQLGGAEGIRIFVEVFSRRLTEDAELGPLFDGVDIASLQQHRQQYFAAVLGGPENYTGRGMREAHRPLGITDEHFDRILVIVDESLVAVSASADAVGEVHDMLERLRPVIVTRRLTE